MRPLSLQQFQFLPLQFFDAVAKCGGFFKGIFGLDFVFKGGSLVMLVGLAAFLILMRRARMDGSLEQILAASEEQGAGGVPDGVGIAAAKS